MSSVLISLQLAQPLGPVHGTRQAKKKHFEVVVDAYLYNNADDISHRRSIDSLTKPENVIAVLGASAGSFIPRVTTASPLAPSARAPPPSLYPLQEVNESDAQIRRSTSSRNTAFSLKNLY